MSNGKGILDTLRNERISSRIEECYDHEQSSRSGRIYVVGDKVISTPEFAKDLKLTFRSQLDDHHPDSIASALNALMRQRHGTFSSSNDEPEFLDEPASYEITIPEGVRKVIICTRDPEAEIRIVRPLGDFQ